MSEPHLAIQQTKDMVVINVRRHRLHGGPRAVLEKPFADALKRRLVHLMNLVHVLLSNVAVHVNYERFDGVRHVAGVVSSAGGVTGDGLIGIVSCGHFLRWLNFGLEICDARRTPNGGEREEWEERLEWGGGDMVPCEEESPVLEAVEQWEEIQCGED
ncbi:cyclic nucleotide-binding domain protein [Striga asiatica]|uniref:Cyclic nucleotide-binding domain protein n=1 Tax=Striga asiatica TaxID=4170 RepID=A0A5A7PIT8_STRAF|nr:cyclic nucleotide-binding domain protein [Striga asiatica]